MLVNRRYFTNTKLNEESLTQNDSRACDAESLLEYLWNLPGVKDYALGLAKRHRIDAVTDEEKFNFCYSSLFIACDRLVKNDGNQEIKTPVAWAKSVMKRAFIDKFHRQKLSERMTTENLFENSFVGDKTSALDSLVAAEEVELLHKALEIFPEKVQEVIRMRYQGITYKEIAEKTGYTIKNAAYLFNKAKKKLEKMFSSKF